MWVERGDKASQGDSLSQIVNMNNKQLRSHALQTNLIARMVLSPLCIGGFVSLLPQANAGTVQPQASPSTNEGAIHLTAKAGSLAYDFGLMRVGASVKHIFTVRNAMAASIVLDRAAPSCHCTGALLLPNAEGGMRLAPGQTMQVQVTLDTQEAAGEADPRGRITKTVSIFVAGQPIHPAVVLTLTGRIAAGAAFDPPVLDFGTISTSQGTRRTVRLFFASPTTRLAAVGDDRLHLRRLDTASKAPSVQMYQVEVQPLAAAGPLNAALAVVGSTAPTATLPVMGQVTGKVSARPPSLVFGVIPAEAIPQADTARRTRWVLLACPSLHSPHTAAFWVHTTAQSTSPDWQAAVVTPGRLSSSAPGLKPPDWALDTGATCWLRVMLRPAAPAGQWLSTHVTLTFPGGDRLIVPVSGENALSAASEPSRSLTPKDARP